jgi:hypothetical protein
VSILYLLRSDLFRELLIELLGNESPFQLFPFPSDLELQLAIRAIGNTKHHNELFVTLLFLFCTQLGESACIQSSTEVEFAEKCSLPCFFDVK